MKTAFRVSVLCLAATLSWLSPKPANSAGLEQASKVLSLNREAMELYEELEFELAKRSLDEAVNTIRAAHLEEHMVASKTYGNLGVLFASGFKDAQKSAAYFQSALAVKADYEIPKEFRTPEAVAALAAARKDPAATTEAAATPKTESEPAATAPTTRPKGSDQAAVLRCPSSGDVFLGDDVTLRCVTTPGFTPASVVLYYKGAGEDDFTALPMRSKAARNNKAMWSASIPAREISGKWVPFYFEAKDQGGETLALVGRNESPNILTVKGGDPDVRRSARGTSSSNDDGDNGDDNENPLAKARAEGQGAYAGRWFLGLGLGSGMGYSPDPKLEIYGKFSGTITPGMLFAGGGHALPELGYMVTDTVGVSLQVRWQYIPRPDNVSARGAFAGLLRGLFYTGTGPSRLYGVVQAGGGDGFRLQMKPSITDATTGTKSIKQDTVRGGPMVAGVGAGFAQAVGASFDLTLETNVLAGVPDFALAFDINAGVRATF